MGQSGQRSVIHTKVCGRSEGGELGYVCITGHNARTYAHSWDTGKSSRLGTCGPPAAWLNDSKRVEETAPCLPSVWGTHPKKATPGPLGDPPNLSKDAEVLEVWMSQEQSNTLSTVFLTEFPKAEALDSS